MNEKLTRISPLIIIPLAVNKFYWALFLSISLILVHILTNAIVINSIYVPDLPVTYYPEYI